MKKRLDENGDEIEGLNIPMSVGPAHTGLDHNGATCDVYDIIVNPKVVLEAFEDKTGKEKDFLSQLAIQSVEQKYKISLDKRYKLPKLIVFGELQQQYIQDRKKMPKIEEVSSKKNLPKNVPNEEKVSLPKVDLKLVTHICWMTKQSNGDDFVPSETPWTHNIGEYVEPLSIVGNDIAGILVTAEVENIIPADIQFSVSPFKLQVINLY